MAIVRRGTPTTAAATTGVTSLAFNVPAGVINGDVMWAWLVFGDAVTNVTLTGWTLVDSSPTTTIRGWLYRRVASSEPASYTVTWTTTTKPAFACAAYSGVDTTTPEDQHGLASETVTRTTHTTPSLTPASTGRWAIAFYGDRSTSSATKNTDWTSDAALTEITDANNNTAASSPWMSACIDDSNGAVTAAAHSYTATSQISVLNALMALVIANPAASVTAVTATDAASATETAAVTVALTATDPASTADTAALSTAMTGADQGAATETVAAFGVSAADTVTTGEVAVVQATTTTADTAQISDVAVFTAAITGSDTGSILDAAVVGATVAGSDTASADESATFIASVTATDAAHAAETVSVTRPSIQPPTLSGTATARPWYGTAEPRRYDGTASANRYTGRKG